MLCKECCDRVSAVKAGTPAGQCKFAWGCKRTCQRVGRAPIGLCERHMQFLLDSAALAGKQDILKRESVRLVKVQSSNCAYIYRERCCGYEVGDSCQLPAHSSSSEPSPFCKHHMMEVDAVESALETLRDHLSWYLQSEVYKKSLSRPTTPRSFIEVKKDTPKNREELCRSILERLTGKPFPKSRPSWLKHQTTNRLLELDGYCKELQIAFEHDGAQHHDPNAAFAGSKEDFKKQQERDILKNHYCQENGVKLIRVTHDIPANKIEEYLLSQLPPGVVVSKRSKTKSVDEATSGLSSLTMAPSTTPEKTRELKSHRTSKPPKDKEHLYQKSKMIAGGYVWVLRK